MARPRLGNSESKRLQMVITEDELKAIEDWQFVNRVPSKSEAIRRLVQMGLIANAGADRMLATTHKLVCALDEERNKPTKKGEKIYELKVSPVDVIYAHTAVYAVSLPVQTLRSSRDVEVAIEATKKTADDWKDVLDRIDARKEPSREPKRSPEDDE